MAARKRAELAYIPLKDIQQTEAYQRPLSQVRVKRLVENWDDEKAGALILSRTDRVYYVIDGQHRLEAARVLGFDDMPAIVFFNDQVNRRANIFVGINKDRAALNSSQLFKAAVVAGDASAVALESLLRQSGFRRDDFKAYAALTKAYERHGGDWVAALLSVVRRAWPDALAVDANHINATNLIQAYMDAIGMPMDWERYEYMLERYSQTALRTQMNDKKKGIAAKAGACAMAIIDCYNASGIGGSRKGKIPTPASVAQLVRFGSMGPHRLTEKTRARAAAAASGGKVPYARLKPRVHQRVREEQPIVATFGG